MDHRKDTLNRRRTAAGFTLIEIMVVISIMALLLGISANFYAGSMRSQRLATAAQLLASDIDQAVLLAQKENRPVEVRFLRFQPTDLPSMGKDGQLEAAQFRGYQFAVLTGFDSSKQPQYRVLSEVKHFPTGVSLMPSAEFTSFAGLPVRNAGPNDPQFGPPYTIVSFQIRPDGTTTLPHSMKPVVTIVEDHNIGATLPANYRSVTIAPANGHTRVY